MLNLRLLYIFIQCIGILLAIGAVILYPITRAIAEQNERIISARKEASA